MLVREKFEKEFRDLYISHGTGTTIWSPLASGILAGKYNDGNIPDGSRFANDSEFMKAIFNRYFSKDVKDATIIRLNKLADLAKELKFPRFNFALLGLSLTLMYQLLFLDSQESSQVAENLKALDLYKKWTPELDAKVEAILENKPDPMMDFNASPWVPTKGRRAEALLKEGRDFPN
eukprot:CAMPEP_0116881496 /NCGR_PEP_ID=MMETSP0463-20121206/13603_1 /TAXON_ID=181622 /ORGANISM="Strombidinopsis sp, Strain SopsisLIS2011" /LENGTH=176 /DNA_ID=CAMNT_0004533489 /DNA_START=598 /DNA_END=1128 /DNA_ORIENTATION=+